MKKRNILLLLIITFLLTGCTFNYDVKIMLDGTVKESANNKTYVSEIFGTDVKGIDKKVLKKVVDEYLDSQDLKAEKTTYNNDSVIVDVNKEYDNLDEYVKKSPAITNLFKEIKIKRNKKTILIQSVDSIYDIPLSDYNGSSISISLPYKVVNTNANEVDSRTNTYTWKVDNNFSGITLEYKKNSLYTLNVFNLITYATLSTYVTLIAVILVIVFVIFVIIYYYRAIKVFRK